MALKLDGKDDHLTRQDFFALARAIGVSARNGGMAIADLTARVTERAQVLQLPACAAQAQSVRAAHDKVMALVSARSAALGAESG